jgi:putative transposase
MASTKNEGIALPGGGPAPAADVERWKEAFRREALVKAVAAAQAELGSRNKAIAAVSSSGNGRSSLYRWCGLHDRKGVGGLLPKPQPKTRKSKYAPAVVAAIERAIEETVLTPERGALRAADRAFVAKAVADQLPLVDKRVIKRLIAKLDPERRLKAQGLEKKAREEHTLHGAGFSQPSQPLELVQIDHTEAPVEVVHPVTREVMGRPTLTVVLDVFSRIILGLLVTIMPPSSLVLAQALSRAILPKRRWIEKLGLGELDFPYHGLMRTTHTDGASEFHAGPYLHGCGMFNIEVTHRRPYRPEDGAHVERGLRTIQDMMGMLPGKTFADILKRKGYDSARHACLTEVETESVLMSEMHLYNRTFHDGIGCTPHEKWMSAAKYEPAFVFRDDQVLAAFLPQITRKKVQEYGLREGNREYGCAAMKGWVNKPHPDGEKFIFGFDERDPSRVFFFEPKLKMYFPANVERIVRSPEVNARRNELLRINKGRLADPVEIARAHNHEKKIVDGARRETAARRLRRQDAAKRVPSDILLPGESDVIEGVVESKIVHSKQALLPDLDDLGDLSGPGPLVSGLQPSRRG